MDDSTFRIPIGPQHPFLKEPAKFDFDIHGEEIVGARMNIGYNHRGIEKACEARNYYQCLYLLERVCGICSHSHTTAFTQAVEEIMKVEVPRRGLYLRTLVCELERLHSHLLWLGVAAHEVGFDSMFMLVWRDRELVMDILEEIGGNRVNYAINTIGGVRRDINDAQRKKILDLLSVLKKRLDYYAHIGTNEPSFVGRIQGVGKLTTKRAAEMCAVGPFARASDVDVDVRRDDPYAAYKELDFKVVTSDSCDIYGRVIVRVLEIVESCKMIEQLLTNLPEGEIVAAKVPRKAPAGWPSAATKRRAGKTFTSSAATARTSRSESVSAPPRWRTSKRPPNPSSVPLWPISRSRLLPSIRASRARTGWRSCSATARTAPG